MSDTLAEAAYWALVHFKKMDEANAAIHCAPVRYSPVTFRLARALGEYYDEWDADPMVEVVAVLAHDNTYPEDRRHDERPQHRVPEPLQRSTGALDGRERPCDR